MARVVRKVSNKSVRGQKKEKGLFSNKLFWIITSAVLVIGVIVGVLIAVLVDDSSETETVDYFKTEETVKFNVSDYYSVSNYVTPDYKDVITGEKLSHTHVFDFAYDSTLFYPVKNEDNEETYNQLHETLLARLIDLQKEVDSAKEKGVDIELYIIDTSILSNSYILTDMTFAGDTYSDESSSMMFTYIEEGLVQEDKVPVGDKEVLFVTKTLNNMVTTAIPQAINYIKNLEE